jgi:hypothetical protein
MKEASEYRQHAEECRALAKQMNHDDQRDQLLTMAETWDKLADHRNDWVRKHPDCNSEEPPGSRMPER